MDTISPKNENFDLNKSEEEYKKMLDYFFNNSISKKMEKYKSFEDYCKN